MTNEFSWDEYNAAMQSLRVELRAVRQMDRLDTIADRKARLPKIRRSVARSARAEAYRDLGMVRVRGNLGGTYYE